MLDISVVRKLIVIEPLRFLGKFFSASPFAAKRIAPLLKSSQVFVNQRPVGYQRFPEIGKGNPALTPALSQVDEGIMRRQNMTNVKNIKNIDNQNGK